MFLKNTRAVMAKILDDLRKIGFVFFLIVQLLYITFLSTSLFLNFGILIINIVLLIVSVVYLVLRVVSFKIDFNNEKSIMKLGNTSYRRIKIGAQIFTVFSMLYGFLIASEHQSSWSFIIMLATALLCIVQVLIECAIQFIDNRKELLVDAFKHDFAAVYKVTDFFKKQSGDETSAWGDADKNSSRIESITKEFKEKQKVNKKAQSLIRKQNRRKMRIESRNKFLSKFKKSNLLNE